MLPTPADVSRQLDLAMSWFPNLCRHLGRTVHNVMHPEAGQAAPQQNQKRILDHQVEERKLTDRVTLRRTTIEEIEVQGENPSRNDP